MMVPEKRIKKGDAPKTDQRELMRIKGVPNAARKKVVDERQAGRRNPKTDHIVEIKPVQRGAVDTENPEGEDKISERIIHRGPEERRHRIPEGDVDPPLPSSKDRPIDLDGDHHQADHNQDADPDRILPRFDPLVKTGHQGDASEKDRRIPEPEGEIPPGFFIKPDAADPRNEVVDQREEAGRKGAEDHPVDMNRTDAYKGDPREIEKTRIVKFDRDEHPADRKEGHPDQRCIGPAPDQIVIHQRLFLMNCSLFLHFAVEPPFLIERNGPFLPVRMRAKTGPIDGEEYTRTERPLQIFSL